MQTKDLSIKQIQLINHLLEHGADGGKISDSFTLKLIEEFFKTIKDNQYKKEIKQS
jgi:hypothetical protein